MNILPSPNSKKLYKTLKTRRNQEGDNLLLPDTKVLNEHFAFFGAFWSSKTDKQDENDHNQSNDRPMFLCPFDEIEVEKINKQIKNKISAGQDGITYEIWKCCSPFIESYLSETIIKCFEGGVFPRYFKIAKVDPLFKKGSSKDPANYRPISLSSSLSKVLKLGFSNE